jgi:uncharacterized protein (TIGR03435 family)
MSGDFHQAGHLHLTGITLRYLMAAAWQAKEYAIVGGPAWLDSDRMTLLPILHRERRSKMSN